MPRFDPFQGHRFPKDVILLAVRRYCRYPLSCCNVRDMLAEWEIGVDAATVHRWVQKFGPEIRKRAYERHRSWRGLMARRRNLCPGERSLVLPVAGR